MVGINDLEQMADDYYGRITADPVRTIEPDIVDAIALSQQLQKGVKTGTFTLPGDEQLNAVIENWAPGVDPILIEGDMAAHYPTKLVDGKGQTIQLNVVFSRCTVEFESK
jgi:hypothetical protein